MTWWLTAVMAAGAVLGGDPAAELAPQMQTGTLIVSRGDCLAVKVFSHSSYTHVATVVKQDGVPYVYDSMNGVGVRRLTLSEYIETQKPSEVHLFHPARPFGEVLEGIFVEYLDSQQGRGYAVKHHLTGNRSSGVHCAEYVTDGLMACGLIHAHQPARVSPASLVTGVTQAGLYTAGGTFNLEEEAPQPPADAGWCSRLWFDTKVCTIGCAVQMRRWFCCK